MRILFLSFPYASAPGGGERYAEQAIEGLRNAGHEATLVSSSQALLALFQKRGWRAYPVWCGVEPVTLLATLLFPLTIVAFAPFFFLLLAWFRWMHRMKAVVCLSLTDKLIVTPIARLFGMRVIWMEHLVAGRSLRSNPFRAWYAACSRLARVVAVSEAVAASLVEVGVPRERITVIFPGVVPRLETVPFPTSPVIGAIARLSHEKNIGLLLHAFALVIKELPEAKLEIFGDGPERMMLEKRARELALADATTFHGYVERARGAGRFTVLAVPSAKEAFGLAALEAMADGLPVVATRIGGLPEVVEDGKTGLLVPPNDPSAFAKALLTVLRDRGLATRLGHAGRERAASLFSQEKMQNAWIALFS